MEVTAVGVPLHPNKAAVAFWTTCEIVGRKRVPIITPSWKSLMDEEKGQLWAEISRSFEIPAEVQGLMRWQALLAMEKVWKTFKSTLVTEYMNKDQMPFMKYQFMSRDTWDTFMRMKTTAEFEEQSAAHKAIQT